MTQHHTSFHQQQREPVELPLDTSEIGKTSLNFIALTTAALWRRQNGRS
jgi:hypothetical protein